MRNPLEDLMTHPMVLSQDVMEDDCTSPDAVSFHESVCSLALALSRDPDIASRVPPHIADALFELNNRVYYLAECLQNARTDA